MTFPPVSTSTISDDFNINIFPNPATDFVNIEVNDLIIHSPIIIEVINTVGQVKQRLSIDNNNQIQVPVYHLPKGIYFLRMEIDGKIVVRKFMKN
ncbi:MAG: T9SS type A sorting domain-containing protein [Saprospiraceae bacterium]